jgi:predicted NUDIX family phosphoesterase
MSEEVLVLRRELFPSLPKCGIFPTGEFFFEILSRAEFLDRDEAEQNPAYKQLIPYSILRYEESVFHYKRSAWTKESRLHGLYSLGVGGHVNKSDVLPLWEDKITAIEWARDRELREEFWLEHLEQPRLIGLLNDDSNEVGLVHLGVIYEYWLQSPNVRPKEKRNHIHYEFVPVEELISHKEKYESWSRIIIEHYLAIEFLQRR